MLYRYLRDYTPNSPMASPLASPFDALPYDLDPDEEINDTQSWWTEQHNNNPSSRRESSPSVDPMDNTSNPSTRGHSVPPIPIPEIRRSSATASLNGSEQMHISPTNTMGSMQPPVVPQLARMKRKGMTILFLFFGDMTDTIAADYGLDAAMAIKRRAISPGSSPLLSPIAVGAGNVRERRVMNIQDTHNGLEKMTLQD